MDDTQLPLSQPPSAPPAVVERVADEAVTPGADEVTVQMPGRQVRAAKAESQPTAAEKAAEMAMPLGSLSLPPSDELTLPALSSSATSPYGHLAEGIATSMPVADAPTYPSLPVIPAPVYSPAYMSAPNRPSLLGRPFPAVVTVLLSVAAILAVVLTYALAELVGRADWADGAGVAGVVALVLMGATLLVASLRFALGRRALATMALALVLAVTLGLGGVGAISSAPALHRAQAQSFERAHAWDAAITEYKRSGERAPNATDLARVLDASGEAQAAGGRYAQAIATFETVTTQYASSDSATVARALTDTYQTYAAWVRANRPDVPYIDASIFFVAYRSRPTCDQTCKQGVVEIEAQAHFQYGQALATDKRYADAVVQFEQVTGPVYTPKAHSAAATAYLTLGKQKLQQECPAPVRADQPPSESLSIYQKLATTYGDTPEGQQAKDALAAPQDVTGYLYHPNTNPAPTLYLSKTINPNAYSFSNDYTGTYDPSSGLFTFKNVSPGAYYLNAIRDDGSYIHYIWYVDPNTQGPSVHVGSLCGTDWGSSFYKEK